MRILAVRFVCLVSCLFLLDAAHGDTLDGEEVIHEEWNFWEMASFDAETRHWENPNVYDMDVLSGRLSHYSLLVSTLMRINMIFSNLILFILIAVPTTAPVSPAQSPGSTDLTSNNGLGVAGGVSIAVGGVLLSASVFFLRRRKTATPADLGSQQPSEPPASVADNIP